MCNVPCFFVFFFSAYYNKKYRNYGQVSVHVQDETVHMMDDKGKAHSKKIII